MERKNVHDCQCEYCKNHICDLNYIQTKCLDPNCLSNKVEKCRIESLDLKKTDIPQLKQLIDDLEIYAGVCTPIKKDGCMEWELIKTWDLTQNPSQFRVWEIKDQHMFDSVDLINYHDRVVVLPNTNYDRDFDEVILMQYIGLRDKFGKPIYEGDIIKISKGFGGDYYCPESFGDVKYNAPEFYIETFKKDERLKDNPWEGCEVVGNIYENPEFMENKK